MTDDDEVDYIKPDYSHLSIGDMLTQLQRAHIENLLAAAEAGNPSAQVMAQINRYLMDNGIVVAEVPKTIEGHANGPQIAKPVDQLPDYSDQRYDE